MLIHLKRENGYINHQTMRFTSAKTHIFYRTQKQMKANLLMARESMTTRADQNAKHLLFHNRVLSTDDLRARIDRISVQGVSDLATEIFTSAPILAALGPVEKLIGHQDLRSRLKS